MMSSHLFWHSSLTDHKPKIPEQPINLEELTFELILKNLKTKPVPQPCPAAGGGRSGDTISSSLSSAGGYEDEIFLTRPPKDLQCIVCLMVVREPHLITCCGAIICKLCMSLSNAKQECPLCRDTMDHLVVPDKRTRGQTMSLKVKCTNTGCKWTGELLDYHEHVNEKCTMCSVACRYGCGQYFKGADISIHEQANCMYRPYDVIMRYQERLVQAMEDRESKRIKQTREETAKDVADLKLDNQKLKKDLTTLKRKSKSAVDRGNSHQPQQSTTLRGSKKQCSDPSTIACPSCYFAFCKNCMNDAHGDGAGSDNITFPRKKAIKSSKVEVDSPEYRKKLLDAVTTLAESDKKPTSTDSSLRISSRTRSSQSRSGRSETNPFNTTRAKEERIMLRQSLGNSANFKKCPNCGTINEKESSSMI